MATILLLACLIPVGCGSGGNDGAQNRPDGSGPPPASPPPAQTPAEALADDLIGLGFTDFVDVSYRSLLARDPEEVIALGDEAGVEVPGVSLTSIEPAFVSQTVAMMQLIVDELGRFDPGSLSQDDRISLEVYRWFLEDRLASAQFDGLPYSASYFITSVPAGIEHFFRDIHPVETEQDARDFVTRLSLVDTKLNQLVVNVRTHAGNGVVMPRMMLDWSVNRWRTLATSDPRSLGFYVALAEGTGGLPAAVREEILQDALTVIRDEVLPAYERLAQVLEASRSQAPAGIGVDQQMNGAAFYRHALRHHTGTDLTPDEVHELGLGELERIHAEMRAVFDDLGYPVDAIVLLFERVVSESGTEPAGQIVAAYENIIAEAEARLPEAFDLLPRSDVIVVGGQGGGFYVSPSLDGSRPGAFHISTVSPDNRFQMKSLAYHEAVPGHHLQIALAQEQGFSTMRQNVHFTGFIEGWALYAERLAWELGWYDDDHYGNLGRLQFEAYRAARLVVDTGIHSRGWTFDQAVSFFQENVGFSRRAAENQIARYMAWPGQATAYMVGMLEILAVRDRQQAELGEGFEVKAFHNTLLTSGAVPLSMLDSLFE